MAQKFTLKTHQQAVRNGQVVMTAVTPYVRLGGPRLAPPVFVQGGKVWSEGGQEIKDVPAWAQEKIDNLPPHTREEVGLGAKEAKVAAEEPAPAVQPEPAELDPADDLTDINGIGEFTAKRLNEHGIHTFQQLADATNEQIESAGIHQDWIEQAKDRVE